ncbi:matrix-binding protein [Actinoplanes sp. SE50]|uniref:polymorphic toxin-type HINT domain-containing protein n=1 Tax=unclassified Actinoplanes TaxID=2626549 RepID=UPI00023EC879|nr:MULTISPECIES: polymorphic toxin-type HINT domain-containing protein [unclassified Actinoplanes]AEV87633.1 YD repeat-containing protein [Actinoplanes sp. SE50/110]ATO86036.1 matrix-binding protein [Actinoplanes sp. SE50]SLM03450.1 hypothetical protein ACSP50_6739 [Actinoplanes sp. SE50/110]
MASRLAALPMIAGALAVAIAVPQAAFAAPPKSVPPAAAAPLTLTQMLERLAGPATAVPPLADGPVDDADLDRMLCQDLADYDADPAVRAAAQAALDTNDPVRIRDFLDKGLPVYRKAAVEIQKIKATEDRALVQHWADTGTPILRQKAAAALATGDAAKIADFIAIGKAAADAADAQGVLSAQQQAQLIQSRVEQMVAHGGYEVQSQGQLALDSEDPEVIAEFYNHGYAIAAQQDTDAQHEIEDALAARSAAVGNLSTLAGKAARAATAQQQIVAASISATQSLTVAANSMGLVNRYAKQADATYASDLPVRAAGGATHTADLTRLRSDACAESATTARNADQVTAQAGVAATAAQTLIDTGLTHGVDWNEVLQAQGDAATAAKQAAETACHAAEATEAAAKALDADHHATADAANAVKYRQAAEREQAAAEKLAVHAEKLAAAAKAAAADAHAQRLRAEAAAADARLRVSKAQAYYETAVRQRQIAQQAAADAINHEKQAYDAAARAIDQQNIAVSKHDEAKQAYDRSVAAGKHFQQVGKQTKDLIDRAKKSADGAHSKELEAEAAEARKMAADMACKYPNNPSGTGCPGTAEMQQLAADATRARADATAARSAATAAQGDATASSAAADAAADDYRQAAAAAAAAAAAGRAAANEARKARQDAETAAAAATKAIDDATKAGNDATAAVDAARAAVQHAAQAGADADLTRQMYEDAARQAAIAAFETRIAGRAALDARVSAEAIADPAAQAIDVASVYADTDNDAAMAIDLANNALAIGATQSAAAEQHAADAAAAAEHAAQMAAQAQEQLKPAYLAAQKAAEAAQRAVAASKVAVAAARDASQEAAATVAAAEDARRAEAQAGAYAQAAKAEGQAAGQNAGVARQARNGARGFADKAKLASDNADLLAGDTEKMSGTITSISNSVWDMARGMSGLAKTLMDTAWKAYDVEQAAAETAWMRWLQEKSDQAIDHWMPWGADIVKGAKDDLLGMVEGLWYISDCTVGTFIGLDPATDEYTVPDVTFWPKPDKACKTLQDGFGKLLSDPKQLLHWDEWGKNWQRALGMTIVDVVTLVGTDGIGSIFKAIEKGISKDIAKAGLKDLISGAAKYGGELLSNAVTKLGALNAARILDLAESLAIKLTLSPEEIAAMARSIVVKGIDAVEQAFRNLRDIPVVKGLEDLIKSCLSRNSFTADTRVLLAGGGTKPIAEITIGDRVLATDPAQGVTKGEPVTRLFRNRDTALADVTIGSGAVLRTTQEHPFWDATTRSWTAAADLRPGDRLRSTVTAPRVAAVRAYSGDRVMFNLTVDELHTYYVLAGRTPVLVHNCDKNVVLGINRHSEGLAAELRKLEETADAVTYNGDNLKGINPESGLAGWQEKVNDALKNPGSVIHVALDDMEGATPLEAFINAYKKAKSGDYGATDWEMGQIGFYIRMGYREWGSIKWYLNGRALTPAEMPEPNWLELMKS